MNEKTKTVYIIILSVLLVICAIVITVLLMTRNSDLKELTGKVIVTDDNYLLVENDDEDYLINGMTNKYEVGDEVKFTYKEKNFDKDTSPYTIVVESDELIKKYEKEESNEQTEPEDERKEDTKPSTSQSEPTQIPSTSSQTPNQPPTYPTEQPSKNPSSNADDEVLAYFENLETEFTAGSIKDSLKSGFITVADFLFYGGEIKGHTFADLSNSAKLKVLSMGLYFDTKIEEYFPGYKESIASTTGKIYNTAKNEIIEAYLNVATLICDQDESLCTTAKEGFNTLKKNFGLTWSLIKDIAGDGLSSLKNWYEIWSGKQ